MKTKKFKMKKPKLNLKRPQVKLPRVKLPNKLTAWWQDLAARERGYLTILGLFLLVIIIYYAIYTPLNDSISDLQSQINYQQQIIQTIKPHVQQIKALQTSGKQNNAVSASNLLSTVDSNLKSTGLSIYASEVSQTNDNGVQIKFTNVPFDRTVTWLVKLWQQYHIQVTRIDSQRSKTIGNVNMLLTLKVG